MVRNGAELAEIRKTQARDLHRLPPAAMTSMDVTVSATDMASGGHAVSRLNRQLDIFASAKDSLFLSRYEMLGRKHRRRGGEPDSFTLHYTCYCAGECAATAMQCAQSYFSSKRSCCVVM